MGAKRRNKNGAPRAIRRDAKLMSLPEAQREIIVNWYTKDGVDSCLRQLSSELGITVSASTLYEALAYWRSQKQFDAFAALARSQAELEATASGGMTAAEMEEAVDRNFIMLAASTNDKDLYKELRYLRIADQSAKSNARIAELKLQQKDEQLHQKDRELKLELEKFQATLRSKVEQGLEALREELQGNAKAEAIFRQLQEALAIE